MQFKFHMLTFGTEIVILYIAKECVRLRPIPPLLPVTFYITDRTEYRGMHLLFNKNNMAVHYILCVVVYAYATDI